MKLDMATQISTIRNEIWYVNVCTANIRRNFPCSHVSMNHLYIQMHEPENDHFEYLILEILYRSKSIRHSISVDTFPCLNWSFLQITFATISNSILFIAILTREWKTNWCYPRCIQRENSFYQRCISYYEIYVALS